ncbi:MAG: hypothetical protein PHF20_04345, partial [Halothiobacillaceae bacterium]|nr:hypothetical protein [Halothiobacillaceae bacterium]
ELVAPEFELVNEASVAGYINFMQRTIAQGQGDVRADYSSELKIAHDADALVQRLNLILCAEQMSKDTFSIIRNAISTIDPNTEAGKNNRVHAAILMTMSSPDYLIQR